MADRKKKEKQTNAVKGKASPTTAAGKGKARPAEGKGAADQTPQADPIREQAQPIQPDTATAAEPAEFYTDEQLKAAADFVQGVGALQTVQETFRTEVQEMLKKINYDTVQQTLEAYKKNIRGILSAATQGFDAAQNLYSTFQQAADWQGLRDFVAKINELLKSSTDLRDFLTEAAAFYEEVEKELQKPEYEGLTADQLEELAEDPAADPKYKELWQQAQDNARATIAVKEAQTAGRAQRRQIRENAQNSGAIMNLQNGNLVTFSERDLWDAFAPGRISKIGTLSPDQIDKETGRIKKAQLDRGDIIPVNAIEVSYKALFLLNTILANSVENYREYFVEDGAIKFYVKGVLDDLDIDPRIRNDGQLDINRKTAGVLYLEKQFEPLLSFIGTTPNGSRYSVFSYEGYDVNTDTMTIRIPYLFQLWIATQTAFSERKKAKEARIEAGKKPLKKDLKPLEVNTLFKTAAYKEDDTVLEIATYITNVLLNAGTGAHKTEILYKTLIKNCPRLRERLESIDSIPATEKKDGKRINKTARYNSELRKIARAYSLIMSPDKCDALETFTFESFTPTKEKGSGRELIPPTKSTLDGKIVIKWHRS